MNDTKSRIIKGISFFKYLTKDKYNSRIAATYMPKFIELLEDYFGLKGTQLELENPSDFEKMSGAGSKSDDAEFMEKLVS